MVILAVVFTFVYLQRGVSTTPIQVITVSPSPTPTLSPQQNAPRVSESVPMPTVTQSAIPQATHSTTGILDNPFSYPKTYSTPTTSTASTPPPTVSTTQIKTPVPSQAQMQEKLALGASQVRTALVNIICTSSIGSVLHTISGSGIIISPKGVILTNAHIAQFFLLKDYPSTGDTSCVIRIGSPARAAYRASLMFISPAWIAANSNTITQKAPTGTGEHDIALLAITGRVNKQPLPSTFHYIPLATNTPKIYAPIVIGSYAAQFLSLNEIQSSLYPTIVYGQVQKIYTFATSTVDLISLGGTAAAQEGSSGGGIVDSDSVLTGVVTTSTVTGPTQKRNLNALTATYIRRDYAKEMHKPLELLLANTPAHGVSAFAPESKVLRSILVKVLSSQP